MRKTPIIIHDMVIFEEFCNGRCKYCEGFYHDGYNLLFDKGKMTLPNEWKAKIARDKVLTKKISLNPEPKDFFALAESVLDKVNKFYDLSILKLSGGEIFLYDGVIDFVKKHSGNYEAIQLLTNGYLLNREKIKRLSEINNVYFQISLDGVSKKTNFARVESMITTEKLLNNINLILEYGMSIEINYVLTKYNTAEFEEILKYFKGKTQIVIIPRPVRGKPRKILDPSEDQVKKFKNIIESKYLNYKELLPPYIYLERVVKLLEEEKRSWSCHVSYFVLGTNNYGDITTCIRNPNLKNKKNILGTKDFVTVYQDKIQEKPCAYCINQNELFGLYLEKLITKEDLKNIPTFSQPGVLGKMDRIIAIGKK